MSLYFGVILVVLALFLNWFLSFIVGLFFIFLLRVSPFVLVPVGIIYDLVYSSGSDKSGFMFFGVFTIVSFVLAFLINLFSRKILWYSEEGKKE